MAQEILLANPFVMWSSEAENRLVSLSSNNKSVKVDLDNIGRYYTKSFPELDNSIMAY